ncbi:MAG: hypothetical protein WA667_26790 [Candidatus Nitrosopolaris sp.]
MFPAPTAAEKAQETAEIRVLCHALETHDNASATAAGAVALLKGQLKAKGIREMCPGIKG